MSNHRSVKSLLTYFRQRDDASKRQQGRTAGRQREFESARDGIKRELFYQELFLFVFCAIWLVGVSLIAITNMAVILRLF